MYHLKTNNVNFLHTSENRRMFVTPYILTSGHSSLSLRAFFVPGKICGVTPLYSGNSCTACWSSVRQGVGNSLCFAVTPTNLLSVMPYTDSKGLSGKNSTEQTTRPIRKWVSYKKYAKERDAKNCAYAFLISQDQMEAFRLWCETTQRRDHLYIISEYMLGNKKKNI